MQTEVGAHLIMDTKIEHVLDSSQAPELIMEGSKPEISSSKVNMELAQTKTDNDRITEGESKSGSRGCDAYSHNKDSEETSSQSTTSGSSDGSKSFNIRNEWSSLEVSYSDIKAATNNLSESAEIGKGGYGSVYKGKLNRNMVAIKILNPTSKQGQREFFQELQVLYGMRHSNLVKLVGACFKVRALVYEYLPNGSLEDCLNYNPELLTWQMRTRIIYEICSALIYLHSRSVVHGDLKPANILLDANFKSKLSDFGLCRLLPEDMTTAAYLETVPKGTYGYIDPWFMETSILRPGSDLYSFGITSLKLLTGKSPIGLGFKVRGANENSLREMIDPTAGIWPFELVKELVYWCLRCCYHNENWKLLVDMSACLEDMLADIEAHEEGRFKCSPQHMDWKSFNVRGLENGIMQSIERSITPDYVETVVPTVDIVPFALGDYSTKQMFLPGSITPDYVETAVPAVDIVPFDGELVSLSANNQNEIKADPDMQHGSESHNSSGRAPFTVFLWEITTFLCRCFVDLRK